MDDARFDALARSLPAASSRRRVLAGAAGALLAALVPAAAEWDAAARKRRKKRRKKRRCRPTCAAVAPCGPDGCGGSCGPCTGGTCTAGTCTRPAGAEVCRSRCLAPCPGTNQARNPASCGCCERAGSFCDTEGDDPECCSRICEDVGAVGGPVCGARVLGAACGFDAQCRHDTCAAGACACPTGQEPCNGGCENLCGPGRIRNPVGCGCCIPNGANCAGATASCCAGTTRCTGAGNSTCVGLGDGAACAFDAQCASRFGCNNGQCGIAIGG